MTDVRKRLSAVALSLRRSTCQSVDLNVPRLMETDCYRAGGQIRKRKRVILRSNGCSVATCTMCPFTNETVHGSGRTVEGFNYERQLDVAFANDSPDDYEAISIYNDGSFFCDSEMPAQIRQAIYARIASSNCRLLVVESSPRFVTAEKLMEARSSLEDTQLSVGIGLQSAATEVRELCVNTMCDLEDFEAAVGLLLNHGCIPKVYLLIKPPLLSESEAIEDAVASAHYVARQGVRDVTFCPVRVAPNTVVHELYQLGMYRPPWLWTVVEVLRGARQEAHARVACLNLRATDLDSIHPSNCELCSDRVVRAVESLNATGDMTSLNLITCKCQDSYRSFLGADTWGGVAIAERVKRYLEERAKLSTV